MNKVLGNLFVKMMAFVIVCVMTPVLFFSFILFEASYADNMYFGEPGGYETAAEAKSFVENSLADIRENIYWRDIEGLKENKYYEEHRNFFYSIYNSEGELVYSTLPKGAVIYEPGDEVESGIFRIYSDYPAEEVTENGEHVADYWMTGYIRTPLDPQSGGHRAYLFYLYRAQNHDGFVYAMIASFAVCAVLTLYLVAYSGKDSDGEIALRGLNAVGYDIMAVLYASAVVFLYNCAADISGMGFGISYSTVATTASALILAVAAAVTLVFVMNLAAHFKMRYWWRHSLIWDTCSFIKRTVLWIFGSVNITWQLALIVGAWGAGLYMMGCFTPYSGGWFLLAFLVGIAGLILAIWIGIQLEKLKKGGEAIAQGDFDYRTNAKELWPVFRCHAFNLNSAALGMSKAVDDRMKSEHFKTELITNVSHDLKTPLTSIVSYVDLLKKEEIENENAKEYIEVIDRQAAKLKKLTEDLVEASKATSGAVAVNKETLNIGELMNQSLGEFAEKLEGANIIPVINIPEEEINVYTDGRLLWRVFDNLIQNIIKYAQPGTRAYFDLCEEENNAVLVIKNISKEPLNMTAEALMERFVRGDVSRGESEGNGLGLSIAKSLTELCGGNFELFLDGDLYKVVITLPTI